jgi:hypothetical protein
MQSEGLRRAQQDAHEQSLSVKRITDKIQRMSISNHPAPRVFPAT